MDVERRTTRDGSQRSEPLLRSMLSAVSGLRAHQTMMDVVGANISNVNTPGFKASRVTFEEALAEVIGAGSRGGTGRGGTNPLQLGLGARVSTIDGVFTQGASQVTGRSTDLSIAGDGFFIVELEGERRYTRAGAFGFDEAGGLVAPGGARVMGWPATNGVVDSEAPIQAISLPLTDVIAARPTSVVSMGGNLSSAIAIGEDYLPSTVVYDSLGDQHDMVITFTKTNVNEWSAAVEIDGNPVTANPATLTFGTEGQLASASTISVSGFTPVGAEPMAFDIGFGGTGGIVQYAGAHTAEIFAQDGQAIGSLSGFFIGEDGTVKAQFPNGETEAMAQIAIGTFENPGGLVRLGDSHFSQSLASGDPDIGAPGSEKRGLVSSGTLEISNVDLALEFTNLIIAQRGFQANGRAISASDEMLADLVNIRR